MAQAKALRRDYIPFDLILTDQEVVRQFRLNTIKKFIEQGKIDEIEPVKVIEFNQDAFEGYLLLDGNHRSRAAYELGQPCTWAIVLENKFNRDVSYPHGRHIKKLKIINNVNPEDIKNQNWNPKFKSKNILEDFDKQAA